MLPLTLLAEGLCMLIRTLGVKLKECQHVPDKVMSKLAYSTVFETLNSHRMRSVQMNTSLFHDFILKT